MISELKNLRLSKWDEDEDVGSGLFEEELEDETLGEGERLDDENAEGEALE
ncbi:MAG: hypothetical protein HY093_02390 [Candidatus Liptonbacteria bacterium]|nr:hypothetical protein [Candidatus Liptonbacteria bacterium]